AAGELAAFGLGLDHDAGGQVRDADGRVGLVDVLAAGARGAEGVDVQVGRVHLDRLAVLLDRDDSHRCRRGVDAPLALGIGHALHAMGAGLEHQAGVDAAAVEPRDHLAVAGVFAGTGRVALHPPALELSVARVHPQPVAGEYRRLVAAGARAHFQPDAAL